ncbi:MAG: hypothetical protein R2702_00970 [Acidimicrobiales bacterium]
MVAAKFAKSTTAVAWRTSAALEGTGGLEENQLLNIGGLLGGGAGEQGGDRPARRASSAGAVRGTATVAARRSGRRG